MFKKIATFTINMDQSEVLNTSSPDSRRLKHLFNPKLTTASVMRTILAESKEAEKEIDSDNSEFDLKAEIENHPDSLYVKCFAIQADETNDNGDYFSKDELKKATSTFIGVPVFTNHQNNDVEKARGRVVHSWWEDDKNGIMIIARVDAEAYPQLARGIKEQYIMGTSMGASRGHDLVSMADGTKTRVDELQVGDEVFTHSGKIEKVAAICRTQEHSKLYHIKWSSNPSGLALSFEHPVLILSRDDVYHTAAGGKTYRKNPNRIQKEAKAKFVPASELRAEDYVLELIDNTVQDDGLSEVVAWLLGVYAAEGYTSVKDKYVQFCFGVNDTNICKTRSFLSATFSGKITDKIHEDRNGHYLTIFSEDFMNLCNKYVGSGAHHKKLHPNVMRWPLNLQKAFLGAYVDGDGCKVKSRIDKNGHSSGKGSLQASSASIQLLKDIRKLCLRIGVPATLSSHERVASKSTVMDKNTEYVEHMLYMTNTISKKLRSYSDKASSNEKAEKTKFDSFFFDNYLAHRIKDVPIIDNSEPTYYVQIGKNNDEHSDHSYILNDIANHNCQVAYSICSICHNYAETPDSYCSHIQERKTRHISSKTQKCDYHKHGTDDECPICGCEKKETKKYAVDQDAFEYNYGIKFIENSFVVNPACHHCGVTEIIDPSAFLAKVASIRTQLPALITSFEKLKRNEQPIKMAGNFINTTDLCEWIKHITETLPALVKAAAETDVICTDQACIKLAGQKEIQDLTQALDLVSSVSSSMLEQKQQIDLEFLTDLVSVLADLQTVTDELTQQGYGSLPSPGESAPAPTQEGAVAGEGITPMNPTPGGGSSVQSGTAGEAGTVTGPSASRQLNMKKLSQNLLKRSNRSLDLVSKLSKTAQFSTSAPKPSEKKLDINLQLAKRNIESTIDLALETARQELDQSIKSASSGTSPDYTKLLKLKTLPESMK